MHRLHISSLSAAACILAIVVAPLALAEEPSPQEGLLAHWPLNEQTWLKATGEVKDVSGNDHHGKVVGATLAEDEHRGSCAQFHGEDDHIVVGEADEWRDLWDRSVTIEAWAKTRDIGQNWQAVFAAGLSNEALQVYVHRGGFYAFTRIGGEQLRKLASAKVESDRWYHVAVTRERRTGRTVLYVDGEPADRFEAPGQAGRDLTTPLMISSNRNGFNGRISGVKIWSTARTPEQIKAAATRKP